MSTNIIYTNQSNKAITDQQLGMLNNYFRHIYEDEELRVTEHYSFNTIENKITQDGGFYYLSANENLSEVISNSMNKGKSWTFYYNKSENSQKDSLWDFQIIYDNILKTKGKVCFDIEMKEIAKCAFSEEKNSYVGKRKMFYGNHDIFQTPYEDAAAFTFFYNDSTNAPFNVFCEYGSEVDNDYKISEFLAKQDIMAIFPWDQHSYYHSFEPMLP